MVRNIRNKKTKEQKENIKRKSFYLKNQEHILNTALSMIEDICDPYDSDKIQLMLAHINADRTLENVINLLLDVYRTKEAFSQKNREKYTTGIVNNKLKKLIEEECNKAVLESPEFRESFKKFIKEYVRKAEKEYVPGITTVFYMNYFAINKVVDRYFGINHFRKRFVKGNGNPLYLYRLEEYSEFYKSIKIKPIPRDKDRVFIGEWGYQVQKLSQELDYILNMLNQYRERFIGLKTLNNMFLTCKKTIVEKYEEFVPPTQEEIDKFVQATGMMPEIEDPRVLFPTEYNVIKEAIIHLGLNSEKKNLKMMEEVLTEGLNDKAKASHIIARIKEVNENIKVFLGNFEKLVETGDAKYDKKLKIISVSITNKEKAS